jgi:hypothetical protein
VTAGPGRAEAGGQPGPGPVVAVVPFGRLDGDAGDDALLVGDVGEGDGVVVGVVVVVVVVGVGTGSRAITSVMRVPCSTDLPWWFCLMTVFGGWVLSR